MKSAVVPCFSSSKMVLAPLFHCVKGAMARVVTNVPKGLNVVVLPFEKKKSWDRFKVGGSA